MYAMVEKVIKKKWKMNQGSIREEKPVGEKDMGKEGGRRKRRSMMMTRRRRRRKRIGWLQEIYNCGSLCKTAVSSCNARS